VIKGLKVARLASDVKSIKDMAGAERKRNVNRDVAALQRLRG
jgi:hypothetical protein